jgi:hypothetical protein
MDKKHAIFKAAVQVCNQSDCNIAREICERYELPMWKDVEHAFEFIDDVDDQYLMYYTNAVNKDQMGFYIDTLYEEDDNLNIMSMEEFEALAEDYNPQYKSVEDILSKIKELNNLLNNK